MALVQDTTVRFMNPPTGQNFTFSLSKPLNQITLDDIKTQDAYVGFTNFGINTIGEGVLSQGSPVNNPNHCFMWATDSSSLYSDINEVGHWCTPASFPTGVYMRNILIYAPLTVHNNGSFIKTDTESRIVIDITPDANTTLQKLAIGSDHRLVCWYNDDTQSENRVDNYYYIYPAVLFEINSTTYIYVQELYPWWVRFYIDDLLNQGFASGDAKVNYDNESYHRLACGWTVGATAVGEPFFTKFTGEGNSRQIENYNINGHLSTFAVNASGTNYHWRVSESLTDNEDQTVTKQYYANTGFRFKIGGVWYKPIVEGGVVTGYTDDMSVPSEWDTWTTAKNHNVPVGPPGPGPSPLESDEQVTGGAYGSGGFVKMYACKKSELKALQSWMSGGPAGPGGTEPTTVPDNFNPIEQFIGLTGFPIEIPTGTYDGTTFIFRAADNTPVNTGINTKTTLTGTQKYMTKSLTIPTWEKNDNAVPWMDYGATVECYVPFCGVVGLDPQVVMGHSIRIQMWVDFISGDCSAFVECNNDGWHPVAYVGGNLGCAEAMTAAAYGQLMGARAAGAHQMTQAIIGGVKNAVTGTVNSAVSNYARAYGNNSLPVPTGQSASLANAIASATGKISGGAYGAAALVTNAVNFGVSLTQQNLDNRYNYTVAKNSLGTTIAGSFGSQSSWHYPIMPYVKVTWPTPMSKDVDLYGKTFGVPVHKTGNLKDYHGYTICNNVDTSGISTATAEEQSMIKQYLESGVYLP